MKIDFPEHPDIVIKNDGSISIEECVQLIANYKVADKDSVYRDVEYWNQYYNKHLTMLENAESNFAKYCMYSYMQAGTTLVEFGCGNGRDSLFFASRGIDVLGIDTSGNVIEMLNKMNTYVNARFLCEDFSGKIAIFQVQHDYCYSRFTLHAITERQEKYALQNAWNTLKAGGMFFIEARSIKDDICGLGECVGRNSYIHDGHFRRFINREELLDKLRAVGFEIIYEEEGRGFAPYKNQDPILIRIVAKKVDAVQM